LNVLRIRIVGAQILMSPDIYIYLIYMDILHEVFVKEKACLDKPFKVM